MNAHSEVTIYPGTASWEAARHARRRKYRYLISAAHHTTWLLGKSFPSLFPLVFVLGYPKSGTSWSCQLVAECLRLPFPQHSILPIGCAAVVHGHEALTPLYPRAVYVMRDGRDALVSMYFHQQLNNAERSVSRAELGASATLKREITHFVRDQLRKPTASRLNWAAHVRTYLDNREAAALLRYEDLLTDGPATLGAAIRQLTREHPDDSRIQQAIEKFSFARQTGRASGIEDRASYLRKGQAGDWLNYFTLEAAEVFAAECGDTLIRAGYETDDSWVSKVATCVPV